MLLKSGEAKRKEKKNVQFISINTDKEKEDGRDGTKNPFWVCMRVFVVKAFGVLSL